MELKLTLETDQGGGLRVWCDPPSSAEMTDNEGVDACLCMRGVGYEARVVSLPLLGVLWLCAVEAGRVSGWG